MIGDDWLGKFDNLKEYCEVVYLPRTEGISSTQLRYLITIFDKQHFSQLKEAFEILGGILEGIR